VHVDEGVSKDFFRLFGTKEELEGMVKEFEASARRCLDEVRAHLKKPDVDFGAIRVSFHSLRGVARHVGASAMFQELSRLQLVAEREKDVNACSKGVETVAAEVELVAKDLRQKISEFSL